MDKQITLDEWLNSQKDALIINIAEKYPIPRLPKKTLEEEGWVDDWHYCQDEKPDADDVYCGITCFKKTEYYNYTYLLWVSTQGKWYEFDTWWKKWKEVKGDSFPLAWVRVPRLFREKDKGYQMRCDHLEQFIKDVR